MGSYASKLSIQSGYVLVERPDNYEVVLEDQPTELTRMLEICKEADCRKVLIVGPSTKVRLSEMDIFHLGERIAEMDLMIAVVETHDAMEKDVRFLENVATNRGAPIQFFDSVEDAKRWLRVA